MDKIIDRIQSASFEIIHNKPYVFACFMFAYEVVGNYVLSQQEKNFALFQRYLKRLGIFYLGLADDRTKKEIHSLEKQLIDAALSTMDKLQNKDAILIEIEQSTHTELSIILTLIEKYLFKIIVSTGMQISAKDFDVYVLLFGLHLYSFKELSFRVMNKNKVDPKDPKTLYSNPLFYLGFYIFSQKQRDVKKSKQTVDLLHKFSEEASGDLYHPYDPEWSKNNKFISNEQGTLLKTEAEGIFDLLLTKTLNEKFSGLSWLELVDKMFNPDKKLKYFPNSYKKDLENEIESIRTKKTGLTVKDLREIKKETEKLGKLVDKGMAPKIELERELEQTQKKLAQGEFTISHHELEDFEVSEYFIKEPDTYAMKREAKKLIIEELQNSANRQQGRLPHDIVEYIVRILKGPATEFEEAFKLTKIAEAVNTDEKEVRRVLNRIRDKKPFLKDLFISS